MKETDTEIIRYSVITQKNPREIVMLRGSGCKWRKCRFCDYHLDYSSDKQANYRINQSVLSNVKGTYKRLEVINSGSFLDLDKNTIDKIEEICMKLRICDLHFECHWMHRENILIIRKRFEQNNIKVHIKTGVESFDPIFRETVLWKGFEKATPLEIASYFDEVCLLFGIHGQTEASILFDIKIGLQYFKRICINIMIENSMPIKPDPEVIALFNKNIYPLLKDNTRIDILLNNTDFGVGNEERTGYAP